MNINSRRRVCEIWIAVCAVCACGAALTGAPSADAAAALVALSGIPVASLMLWWPSEQATAVPASWSVQR